MPTNPSTESVTCPHCGHHASRVVKTTRNKVWERGKLKSVTTRRERQCNKCFRRYFTQEAPEPIDDNSIYDRTDSIQTPFPLLTMQTDERN